MAKKKKDDSAVLEIDLSDYVLVKEQTAKGSKTPVMRCYITDNGQHGVMYWNINSHKDSGQTTPRLSRNFAKYGNGRLVETAVLCGLGGTFAETRKSPGLGIDDGRDGLKIAFNITAYGDLEGLDKGADLIDRTKTSKQQTSPPKAVKAAAKQSSKGGHGW